MDLELPSNFGTDDAAQVLEKARPVLALSDDARLRVENVTKTARGTRIEFSCMLSVELEGENLAEAAGVQVDVSSNGELRFNSKGALVSYEVKPADPKQVRALSDNLSKLVASGQVYIAKPGEKVDANRLRALGKSWVIEQDKKGNKHLRRAWIA